MTLVTANGLSLLGKLAASVALTTPFTGVGAVTVAGVRLVGSVEANTTPVPSSLIVTVAGVALVPPVLVAVKVNGSLLSDVPSCSGANNTRTNASPLLSSGIKSPAL